MAEGRSEAVQSNIKTPKLVPLYRQVAQDVLLPTMEGQDPRKAPKLIMKEAGRTIQAPTALMVHRELRDHSGHRRTKVRAIHRPAQTEVGTVPGDLPGTPWTTTVTAEAAGTVAAERAAAGTAAAPVPAVAVVVAEAAEVVVAVERGEETRKSIRHR